LIKITANQVNLKMQSCTLRNISSLTASGGVFNINTKEFIGSLESVQASNVGAKIYGTFAHIRGSNLFFNMTQNNLTCKELQPNKLKVQYLSDLLDQNQ
jgi:hypothetical protein